jgi:hypothetical protein
VKHFRFVLAAMLTLELAGSAQTAGSAQMTGSGQKTDSAQETVTVQTTPDPSRVLQTTGERLLTDLKRVPRYTHLRPKQLDSEWITVTPDEEKDEK